MYQPVILPIILKAKAEAEFVASQSLGQRLNPPLGPPPSIPHPHKKKFSNELCISRQKTNVPSVLNN